MLRETPYSNIPNQIPSKKMKNNKIKKRKIVTNFLITWSNLIGKLLNTKTFTQFLQKNGWNKLKIHKRVQRAPN